MTWMLIRLVLSLAFVGLVLWFAARVAKKRGLGGGGAQGLIEVVARQRMGRSSSVNVVRIGDVVLVVGATEEQITLLAEVDNETIDTALHEREGGRPARLPAARAPRSAPAPAPAAPPQHYGSDDYDAHGYGYDEAGYPSRGGGPAYDGERYADHGRERYAAEAYAGEGYAGEGYADDGYADETHADGYPERGHDARRAGGQHADRRYGGGGHRPAPAPSGGALAGSVFDKNGWGTFVNELRERTVRRP